MWPLTTQCFIQFLYNICIKSRRPPFFINIHKNLNISKQDLPGLIPELFPKHAQMMLIAKILMSKVTTVHSHKAAPCDSYAPILEEELWGYKGCL